MIPMALPGNRYMESKGVLTMHVATTRLMLSPFAANTAGLVPRGQLHSAGDLQAVQTLAQAPVGKPGWPNVDWWKGIADPQLDQLKTEALAGSPILKIGQARVDPARPRRTDRRPGTGPDQSYNYPAIDITRRQRHLLDLGLVRRQVDQQRSGGDALISRQTRFANRVYDLPGCLTGFDELYSTRRKSWQMFVLTPIF